MTRALFTLAELEPPGSAPLTDWGRELAERLARSESLRQVAPDLWRMVERLAAAGRVRMIGLPQPAPPSSLLFAAVARIAEADPWGATANKDSGIGWNHRLSVADTVAALERVQRAARELAAALAAAPIEADPFTDFGRADPAALDAALAAAADPAVAGVLRWLAGTDTKQAARDLAARAGRMAKRAAADPTRKPNKPGARLTWWIRALAEEVATPESCEGMTDTRRRELIAALAGAILNESVTPAAVRNSLK